MASQSTSSQKTPWGTIVLVIIVIVVVMSWLHIGPFHRHYTMTANFGGVQIQLTPITPPKALSTLPSDYVQVVVKVGMLTFSTDDPQFTCLESLTPLFFKETSVPDVILVAYENCGQIVHTEHEGLAMLPLFLPNSGDSYYAMFTFPDNSSTLCSSNSSQCIDFATATPVPPPTLNVTGTGTTCPTDANGNYTCTITLTLVNSGSVDWSVSAESDLPGTTIDPQSGTLSSDGQTSQQVTITVPSADCPAGGHIDISWTGSNPVVVPFTC